MREGFLSLAFQWPSSCCAFTMPFLWLCPNFSFQEGQQSYWIKVHPIDLTLIRPSVKMLSMNIGGKKRHKWTHNSCRHHLRKPTRESTVFSRLITAESCFNCRYKELIRAQREHSCGETAAMQEPGLSVKGFPQQAATWQEGSWRVGGRHALTSLTSYPSISSCWFLP